MIETTNGEYPDDHHGHDHEHGHHHVHDFEPQPEPVNEIEPIKPELLEWYRSQPEVIFDVVQHSHLDYAWYRDREASKMREVEAFVKTIKVDNFTLEQTITAKEFIEGGGKDLKNDLLNMIREGRMELIGHYIQPEVFASPEESTFWNIELGRKTARDLGVESPSVGYNPDTFGFPDTLPMIYKHAGIDTFIFMRGFENVDTIGALFKWKSPDGSEILGVPMQGGYSNARGLVVEMPEITDKSLSDHEREHLEQQQYNEQVHFATIAIRGLMNRFGDRFKQIDVPHFLVMKGDDFTKPDKNLSHILEGVQAKMRADTKIENFQIRTSSLGDYAALAQRSIKRDRINTYMGEMRSGKEHFVLRGTDSTRMPLKQFMHKVDTRIYDAGVAVAQLLLARKYGIVSDNEHATRQQVYSYFHAIEQIQPVTSHDTILGCGSDNAYPLPLSLMSGAYETANQTVRNTTAALANRLDTYGPHRHIEHGQSFFNQLPESRTAIVEVPMQGDIEHAAGLKAYAKVNGKEIEIPVQILLKQDIRYAVCALPMEGLSVADIRLEPADPAESEPKTHESFFENEQYTVWMMPNGTLNMIDKHTGAELVGLEFEDRGDRGDEYTYCPVDGDAERSTKNSQAKLTVVNDGPVFTELQIDTALTVPKSLDGAEGEVREVETRSNTLVDMPISTRMRIYKHGIDRIEFATTVNNTARDHRLRVRFSAPNAADTVRAKEPYGMTTRTAVPISGGEGWVEPYPIATSHSQGIVTAGDLALFSKGLPEYEAIADDDGTISHVALTLFRSVGYLSRGNLATRPGWAGPGTATPEAQLPGEHIFEYAVNLRGKQSNSDVIRQANDYTHIAENGFADATLSDIITVKSDAAVMSALRPTMDGDAVIARFYNPNTEPTTVTLSGLFEHAVKCDPFGNVIDDTDAHHFEMPTGIVSIRLS